jgi:ribonuclease BN (tRNA processing enzyme)
VRSRVSTFLIDCGVTSLIGMRRLGFQPNEIDTVFVSHLHGDHFGGLPWLLVDALYVSNRNRPLIVTGPKGVEARFLTAAEALYPNITTTKRGFELSFVEYEERTPLAIGGVSVTPFEVKHPSGAPPYALRFEIDGKVLAFTGDTGWVEVLGDVAQGADLFISECFQYDVTLPIHLDYATIDANYRRLGAKRVLLTHMGEAMLANIGKVDPARYVVADDGMTLDL